MTAAEERGADRPRQNPTRETSQSPRSSKRQRLAALSPTQTNTGETGRNDLINHASSSRPSVPRTPTPNAPILAAKPSHLPTSAGTSSSPAKTDMPVAHKRRFTRSRSGCSTCRSRKVKCDEERPRCRRCIEDGRTCEGYDQQPQPQRHKQKQLLASSSSQTQCLQAKLVPAQNQEQIQHSHRSNSSQSGHEHQSVSPHESGTAGSFAFTNFPVTSPQHLDDWIDLLCASIGNDISQSSSASTASKDQGLIAKNAPLNDEHGQRHHLSTASHRLPSTQQDNNKRSVEEQGLSTLASAAVASQASLDHASPAWLHEDWLSILTASPANSERAIAGASSSSAVSSTGLSSLERITEADLQRRIRTLCVTKVQLESVSFFFNTTARCFHLLSADTNVWRIFFAQLASESPIILDLIGCLGLTHLSLTQDHRKKGLAHAHFSRCKTEWDGLVGPLDTPESIDRAAEEISTPHHALEVLAGTILIAHIEQFSRGFATSSRAYTALAITLIRRILSPSSKDASVSQQLVELDRGPGSAFRFFVRILLWWETMSRTMGPSSERGDVLDIFQHVYRWEEEGGKDVDPVECFTQCVVGWPLDLLEAVEQTTRISVDPEISAYQPLPASSPPLVMPSGTLSHALEGHISLELQQQIDAVETQIRLARPLPLAQDDSIAAELRYLIFECLQSASLVFFSKVLLKSTDAVWFEIDKVTRFLERKQQRPAANTANAVSDASQVESGRNVRTAFAASSSSSFDSVPADLQLAQAMESRGHWWIRAPDGALIWAYFQCASEIFGALDPSAEVITSGKESAARPQVGKGDPIKLALGSQLTLGSESYADFARSRSERRQRCRRSLLLWERFDEIQCIFLCRHLLKAIWDRRDLYEQHSCSNGQRGTPGSQSDDDPMSRQDRYDQAAEIGEICQQRRWKQPLIF